MTPPDHPDASGVALDRSPSSIEEEGEYWLRSRDVSDAPRIADDGYHERHDVARAEELTEDDLPPVEGPAVRDADPGAVRAIDREALERGKVIGKWQVTGSAERVDDLFPRIVADAAAGRLWAAKATTGFGHAELPYEDHVIAVYTPNYFETGDVERVRERLREAHGVTHDLYYKPDIYTGKGIVADSVAEFGLSVPARYVG